MNHSARISKFRCQIKGAFPEPTIEWQDSSRRPVDGAVETKFKQNEDGRYDRIVEVTVSQSGTYYCVATQKGVCHQTERNATVYISGESTSTAFHVER